MGRFGKMWKGHRHFWGVGVIDVISASSISISYLLDHSKGFNLKNVKPFDTFSFKSAQQFKETGIRKVVGKSIYFDVIYENHLAAFELAKATGNGRKRFHNKLIEMEMGGVVDKHENLAASQHLLTDQMKKEMIIPLGGGVMLERENRKA